MQRLPAEARDGLMRAWLAILQDRHPGLAWVPVDTDTQARVITLRQPTTNNPAAQEKAA